MIQDSIAAARAAVAAQAPFLPALYDAIAPHVTPVLLIMVVGWVWKLAVKIAVLDKDVKELKQADIASRLASIEATQAQIMASLTEIRQALIGKGLQ